MFRVNIDCLPIISTGYQCALRLHYSAASRLLKYLSAARNSSCTAILYPLAMPKTSLVARLRGLLFWRVRGKRVSQHLLGHKNTTFHPTLHRSYKKLLKIRQNSPPLAPAAPILMHLWPRRNLSQDKHK